MQVDSRSLAEVAVEWRRACHYRSRARMKALIVTEWGESIELHIQEPKPGVPIEASPYVGLWRRCGDHRCNRLLPTRANGPSYCGDRCQKRAERQRAKERAALS